MSQVRWAHCPHMVQPVTRTFSSSHQLGLDAPPPGALDQQEQAHPDGTRAAPCSPSNATTFIARLSTVPDRHVSRS